MIFYFYGPNSYLIKKAISDIRQKYISKSGNDHNIVTFDMSQARLGELIDAITASPLIVQKRLVIAQNMSSNKTVIEKIKEIINLVPETTILVIEDFEPDKRSSFYKLLSTKTKAKCFENIEGTKLENWVKNEFLSHDIQLDGSTIRYLIQKAGEDMWQLKNEIEKLSCHTKVTREAIDKLVVANVEQSIFELIDSVAKKDLKQALKIYRNLNLKGISDQQILAMLNWQYRNLALAYDNLGKSTQWIKDFSISDYVAKKSISLASKIDLEEISLAYQAIVDADFAIKTGQKPSGRALEELLIKLTKSAN